MSGAIDFSGSFQRHEWRAELRTLLDHGQTNASRARLLQEFLVQTDAYISKSGKTAWDKNGNRCSGVVWIYQALVMAEFVKLPSKRLGNPGKPTGAQPRKTPAKRTAKTRQPAKMGWDDFDWSV